jgi:hypothetical protein
MIRKQQHFVPHCYLKNFANPQEQIFVMDKDTQKYFQPNIKNIASATYFGSSGFEGISKTNEKGRLII